MRQSELTRKTAETSIFMRMDLDGEGSFEGQTGIGFFDHMMVLFSRYSGFNLMIDAVGDIEVDTHHLVEDLGIVMGNLFKESIGDCRGIERYGSFRCPMDEALTEVDLDISGRGYLVYNVEHRRDKIGDFETEMLKEFMYAFAINAGITLHINNLYGSNEHHIIESIFKAFGKALGRASEITDKSGRIPSTKGKIGA
ncbi:MAG: imidazoleglycerol-phosphate dehydratase HisB [Tissierellia bacterium]|nr:imidazoleglycerol-phosphate dehydratase HisB [Tissierellia bacterium]